MAPRYVVSCLAPCRGGARKVLGLTPSSESVCPGCEGGCSVGEGFCHNLTTAPEDCSELGEGGSLGVFSRDQYVVDDFCCQDKA